MPSTGRLAAPDRSPKLQRGETGRVEALAWSCMRRQIYRGPVFDEPLPPDLEINRTMAATPDQIWSAWLDPTAIARWWGPDGFTSTVEELDVQAGGRFDVIMHGPDGVDYRNRYLFEDVSPGVWIVYVHQGSEEHGLAPSRSEMLIEALDADSPQSRVTLRSFYASDADRRRHLEDFQAAAGASQLLERLEAVAAHRV